VLPGAGLEEDEEEDEDDDEDEEEAGADVDVVGAAEVAEDDAEVLGTADEVGAGTGPSWPPSSSSSSGASPGDQPSGAW
jgi:hypothetical protein